MRVSEVICQALRLVGREDAADSIGGGEALSDEVARLKRACLTYLNAVVDELARGYFPPEQTDELSSPDGKYAYADFSRVPHEIRRVKAGGKQIAYRICPDYMYVDAPEITVTYRYVPAAFNEDDEFTYPVFAVGPRLVCCGIVAEYYLVMGDAASSAAWEEKYRAEIDNLLSHSTVKGIIPPRRWI